MARAHLHAAARTIMQIDRPKPFASGDQAERHSATACLKQDVGRKRRSKFTRIHVTHSSLGTRVAWYLGWVSMHHVFQVGGCIKHIRNALSFYVDAHRVALRLREANELLVNRLVRSDNERSGDGSCGQMDGWMG